MAATTSWERSCSMLKAFLAQGLQNVGETRSSLLAPVFVAPLFCPAEAAFSSMTWTDYWEATLLPPQSAMPTWIDHGSPRQQSTELQVRQRRHWDDETSTSDMVDTVSSIDLSEASDVEIINEQVVVSPRSDASMEPWVLCAGELTPRFGSEADAWTFVPESPDCDIREHESTGR
eukprot:TRINITY_DN68849_c0_g1_i1.p1 TRINITY_DN68849_c0_g1~~TRINITY_DN68849_c0_g1_i1.p1  ORF type:complete len:175 (+),score=35.66 TRINITY_DN68849_c0_g1_i1:57-581(+)